MKTSNAWHQSKYRQTLRSKNLVQLNVVIDSQAKDAIERLAQYYGISQREIIERFVIDAENRVMAAVEIW